jgi:hypothetical protein
MLQELEIWEQIQFLKSGVLIKLVWSKNGTPNTLTGSADTVEITDLGEKKFNQCMCHIFKSGSVNYPFTFNNDTGSNYTWRNSNNGGADGTTTSAVKIDLSPASDDSFNIGYFIGISSEEKLLIEFQCRPVASGAGTAPGREEVAGKWANTSNTVTEIDVTNGGSGDWLVDSNISAIGTD